MTKIVTRDHIFFAFNKANLPVTWIKPGEEIILETLDCFEGNIQTEGDLVQSLDPTHDNPATGPIYLEGAKPGDIVRIDVLEIQLADEPFMVCVPGQGALGDVIRKMETTILRRKGDQIIFKDRIHIGQNPMIGVIGVTPQEGNIANTMPGRHGGNLDCILIGKGASLYLTVEVEGALIGVGDLHAAMGDGEIVICGAETSGLIRLKTELVDLPGLPTPFVENEEVIATLKTGPTADQAADGAIHAMADFLTKIVGLSLNDAGMLMSLAGSLKFCQVVDPEITVRFEFPKSLFEQIGFTLRG